MNVKKINNGSNKIDIIAINKIVNFNNNFFNNPFANGKFYIDNKNNLVCNVTIFKEECLNEEIVTDGECIGIFISLDKQNILEIYINESENYIVKFKGEKKNQDLYVKSFKGGDQRGFYWCCEIKINLEITSSYFNVNKSFIDEDIYFNFINQFIIKGKKYVGSYCKIKDKKIASIENMEKIIITSE